MMGQQDWPYNTTGKQHKLTSLQHHLRKHMQAQVPHCSLGLLLCLLLLPVP
jgi:hypothetical protein